MNAADRKTLRTLLDQAHTLRSQLADVGAMLEELASAERDKVENMPEGLRYSDKGEEMDEKCTTLEEAHQNIESALDEIENALTSLDDLL